MGFDRKKWGLLWEKKHYRLQENGSCAKCDTVQKFMIRIGAVVFCAKCVQEEFNSEDPVREERETYLKWLVESHRKLDLTWSEEQGKYIEDDEKEYKISVCCCRTCQEMRSKYELSKKDVR
jgi:hypothetical protein